MERFLVYENITGYLKNHWTKHRHVCTHFYTFSMLIPNMGISFKNCEIFENVLKKTGGIYTAFIQPRGESVQMKHDYIRSARQNVH